MSQMNTPEEEDLNFECLLTKSLVIRRMKIEDIPIFYHYRADKEVEKYQGWENFTMDMAVPFVEEQTTRNPCKPGQYIQLTIAQKETDQSMGDCCFMCDIDEPRVVHMGITIAPHSQRQGVAYEALLAVMKYLFVERHKHRIVVTIDAKNVASIALFEKLKFRKEGHFLQNCFFKGQWGDEVQFAMLRSEWMEKYVT